MKFTFYEINNKIAELRPNVSTRKWMDETSESYAYRCLPLNIANAHGWSFHLKFPFFVHWNGEITREAIKFRGPEGVHVGSVAASAFGHGIVTFFIPGIFRTPKGWDMMVSGPINAPKDGIAPLQGVIETDWSPYSFTMNWQVTRPNTWIGFEADEPYCTVYPVRHAYLEEMEPEIRPIESNPELHRDHEEWSKSRNKFVNDLNDPGSEASRSKWQKNYYRGQNLDGSKGQDDHITKLRLKPFKRPESNENTPEDGV